MKQIGLLSDTHGFIHPKVPEFFMDCDELWHAGDIGNIETAEKLSAIKPLRAVYGNIDDFKIRRHYKAFALFKIENLPVLIIHIGGYPGKYTPKAQRLIQEHAPKLFISGHSHILKVMYDKKYDLLHMNPGAAGKTGLHNKITLLRFSIDGDQIKDLEVFEANRREAGSGL